MPSSNSAAILDLGEVLGHESVRVSVNGTYVGTMILPPYRLSVPRELLKGPELADNEFTFEVAERAANRIRQLDCDKVQWKYFYDANVLSPSYKPLDASTWPEMEHGVKGPVTLLYKEPNLRVGIVSDVHVHTEKAAHNFSTALRYFDARKVDAVLIVGDLVTWGRREEFELFKQAWDSVFPGNRRSDGVELERLMITGNHDVDGFAYWGSRYETEEEVKGNNFHFHRQEWWLDLFGEEYLPIVAKSVKGYVFVLRNWVSVLGKGRGGKLAEACRCEPDPNPLAEFLSSLSLPLERPFFYVQHEPPNDTVNAEWLISGVRWNNGQDDGYSTKILAEYPQAICFSGDSHNSLTDELSIWQGAFTALNCSATCGYAFTPPGRENGWCCEDFKRDPPLEMPAFDNSQVCQGLVMDVYDDRVFFERRDFRYHHRIGPDWVVPVGLSAARPYQLENRLKEAKAPCFAEGTKVTIEVSEGYGRNAAGTTRADKKHPQVFVSFPPVRTSTGSPVRAWDYAVRAEVREGDRRRTLRTRYYFSEGAFYAEEDEPNEVRCAYNLTELRNEVSDGQSVRFAVVPRSSLLKEGVAIYSEWLSLP